MLLGLGPLPVKLGEKLTPEQAQCLAWSQVLGEEITRVEAVILEKRRCIVRQYEAVDMKNHAEFRS